MGSHSVQYQNLVSAVERRADLSVQAASLVAALAGTLFLLQFAGDRAGPTAVVACSIYGTGLVAMFSCSLVQCERGFLPPDFDVVPSFGIRSVRSAFKLRLVGMWR